MRVRLNQQLLDRQIVDRHGRLVGKVDDIAFDIDDDGVPYLRTLLVGHVALGRRLGGRLGRLLVWLAHWFARDSAIQAREIPFYLVRTFDSTIWLSAARDELPESPMERLLRRGLITHIPGAGHAGG